VRKDLWMMIARASLLLSAGSLMPGTAHGFDWTHPGSKGSDPSAGYTVPILLVYQFPAVLANQPGAAVPYLTPNPSQGLLGGRPYLYHR
jgi:hypothetical protein